MLPIVTNGCHLFYLLSTLWGFLYLCLTTLLLYTCFPKILKEKMAKYVYKEMLPPATGVNPGPFLGLGY